MGDGEGTVVRKKTWIEGGESIPDGWVEVGLGILGWKEEDRR